MYYYIYYVISYCNTLYNTVYCIFLKVRLFWGVGKFLFVLTIGLTAISPVLRVSELPYRNHCGGVAKVLKIGPGETVGVREQITPFGGRQQKLALLEELPQDLLPLFSETVNMINVFITITGTLCFCHEGVWVHSGHRRGTLSKSQ